MEEHQAGLHLVSSMGELVSASILCISADREHSGDSYTQTGRATAMR